MRARFVAPRHEGQTCVAYGMAFPHGTWVDVSGLAPEHVDRLADNPTFEVARRPTLRLPAAEGAPSEARRAQEG
jgi:hypothetical protein